MIKLKGVVMEDFVNYKKPSMFLITCYCDFKCCVEANLPLSVCQNEPMAMQPIREFKIDSVVDAYLKNDITKSIVFGGLEPIMQFDEVYNLISNLRSKGCDDDVVIYTGYYENEIADKVEELKKFPNIIIKYGRFIPGHQSHRDEVLGIELASDNQHAERIS